MKQLIFLTIFFFSIAVSASAQGKTRKVKKKKQNFEAHTIFIKPGVPGQYNGAERSENFRSPFRYIIFSNLTEKELETEIPQRRLEVLIDEKAFNEKNLKLLFSLLKERFPLSIRLEIEVHTSLATIETPEEQETVSDHTSREYQMSYHRMASYTRFDEGSEIFQYDYGKPPGFWTKFVDLPDSKQKLKIKSN